ncbi:RAM signaling pathway protein-domain-containing protein [Irpex rosettiformis]|uniref:RAM signaling pathway protein-domain-containing protein n=1 Tax=Irpex rosettiformis TaxID=378272 RepID=A0ACB8UHQ5_9APHY|nr:RAM signaling pathway protein-domain-containing protein [Irpex rosettiformis]
MAITDNEASSIGRPSPARTVTVPSPLPSVSLSREHITEAFKNSPDGGVTLDLTKRNLSDVGEDGASELAVVGHVDADGESAVVRIALAHNRLATLPMAFALLTRLRYLVLKDNNFTIFPDVLTVMPSLEILDISRNKIKRLPSQPGSLTKLRVFSLSRNKIHRLPAYFSQFHDLNLFKVDHNPLEWPPRNVMEPSPPGENTEAVKAWIQDIQDWIQQNSATAERKISDEQQQQEASLMDLDRDSIGDDSLDIRPTFDTSLFIEDSSSPQHHRTFSLDSEQSNYSDNVLPMPTIYSSRSPKSPRPPRLHLDAVSAHSSHTSPHRSPDSYLPTPDDSVSSTDEDLTQTQSLGQLHGRNASFAGSGGSAPRSHLPPKKSMPDLRPAKLNLNGQRDPSLHTVDEKSGMPSPPHRQESDSSNGSLNNFRTPKFSPSVVASPVSLHRPAPHMEGERHKYFRRMSSLNMGTLVKTTPPALLTLVDGIRGILFGVSQIYQGLQHYTEYAIDERLSAVLLKVLDPASLYMNQLINALDRFDTMSRRTVPSPAVCRSVVETCRDNVNMFGKAVGVLTLQLKVLATHDDVRYTRQMLLMLYGAMAEIAGAWTSIASQMEAVKSFLREHGPPSATKSLPTPSSSLEVSTPSTGSTVTPTPSHSAPRMNVRSPVNGTSDARARMARRHAGSFSYKDVELGMLLPSNLDSPPLSSGLVGGPASSIPVPRTMRRIQTTGPNGIHGDGTIRPSVSTRADFHSRQSSASSFLASATSSPALALAKSPSFEAMSSAHTIIDGVAVDAIRHAVESAPPVWNLLEALLRQDPILQETLLETLRKAEDVTFRLQEDIRGVATDSGRRKVLREDAHMFANTVTQLLNVLKTYGTAHSLSSDLRNSMVQLSQATQDFLMLLHVSSFSPAQAQRPYSPMVGILSPPPPPQEDNRLGANLSRSRSAVASVATRTLPLMKDPPRSALPHGSFMLSPPR